MIGSKQLVFALCLLWSMHASVQAQPERGESRGALLYATHCNACHSLKFYWRERKLATDWDSLKAQVRHWQASLGLGWSEEEIKDVTDYLNSVHYAFPAIDEEGFLQKEKSNQVLRQN